MPSSTKKGATYDDLREVSDDLVAEIADGELYTTPRPAPRHTRVTSALGASLFDPFDLGERGPGGWWILDEPELHLGLDILVPDLGGWRRERMPVLPDESWFEIPPDWVCEVVSPKTSRLDRDHKMPIYAMRGVEYFWLIDPATKTLEVYRLEERGWHLVAAYRGDEVVRAGPFEAIDLRLAVLWG